MAPPCSLGGNLLVETSPSVLISIPTRENIHADTVGWCLREIKKADKAWYDVNMQIIYSPYPIEMQRNNQVKSFLEVPYYTHLFLLDSDCVPPSDCLETLLEYDLDMVSSVAPAMLGTELVFTSAMYVPEEKRDPEHPDRKFFFPNAAKNNWHGVREVDGVGMTGVLVKRHVLEHLEQPLFRVLYEDGGVSVDLGEDFYFCRRVKEAGFKIWADFSLRQKHYKTIPL